MKSNSVIKTGIIGQTLTIAFAGIDNSITVDALTLSDTIRQQAMMHGLRQKLCDAGALSRNPTTGKSATVLDKFNAIKEVFDTLMSGDWNRKREAVTGNGGLFLRALCAIQPAKTQEQVAAWLATKSKAEVTAMRDDPRVIAKMRELAPLGDVDVDGLFADLETTDIPPSPPVADASSKKGGKRRAA